jgi:glycosyltransferase involved in cell wall biosynthesis
MKILFLIRALTAGGAERQVAVLAKGLRQAGHSVQVAVFYGGGELEADLAEADVPLIDLGKRGRWDNFGFLWRLVRTLRRERPDAIYSWLAVANILTGLLCPFFPKAKRVWAICASNMDLNRYDWLVRLTTRIEARLSPLAHVLISNSHSGRDYAIEDGFPPAKLKVVPNGIDTRRFRPDREAGRAVRAGWGIEPELRLIGLVGRLDPMKGHPDFLRAAALLHARHPGLRFVCVGDGAADYRESLHALAGRLGLDGCLVWAGTRTDMPAVYNALDIAVSSSVYGEGLPNMLGEAMASGLPCVVTRVGDSPWVVGDIGTVVPPGDPAALADGVDALLGRLDRDGPALSRAARQRVEEHLSVESLVHGTLAEIEALP